MMRVLHIISSIDPRSGGTTTALAALAHAQLDVGMGVSIASTYALDFRSDTAEALRKLGVRIELIGPNKKILAYHPRIRSKLRELIPAHDIIHIHGLWEEIQHRAAKLCRKLGKPYIMTPHGMLDPWSLSQGKWKKRLYMLARMRTDLSGAAAIHFSDEIERDLTEPLNLPAPSLVQRHIVDLSEFDDLPARGTFRARYPHTQNRPMVLFLSRVHPKKGLDLLIPAFANCESKDSVLVLAGPCDDAYRVQLDQLVEDYSIKDRVIFAGMQYGRDRVAAFVDADLFVLPSYQENFGIVVIESLAAGTPVIISDQVNIHRQITKSEVGQVVPTQTVALTAALSRWLRDEKLRMDTAAKARPFVEEHYNRDTIARQWVEHYERLVNPA